MIRLKLLVLVLSTAGVLAEPPPFRVFFGRFKPNKIQYNRDPWQPMVGSGVSHKVEGQSTAVPSQTVSYVTKHHHYVQYGDGPPQLAPPPQSYGAPAGEPSGSYGAPAAGSSGAYGAPAADPSGSYGAPAADPSGSYGAPAADPSGSYGAPAADPSGSYGAPAADPSGSYGVPTGSPSVVYGTPAVGSHELSTSYGPPATSAPVVQAPVLEQPVSQVYQYGAPALSYGLPAVTTTKLEESGNIFQARAPKEISLGGQQSFFFSPKENALYQVTKIQLAPGNALPLDLSGSYGVPAAPSLSVAAPAGGVSEVYGAPSSQYGAPSAEYGPPKTVTTTPAPSTTVVYRYKSRPKFNFTLEIVDNECYEEVTPEEVGENKNPHLTVQPIRYYRKKRGVDPERCNGPENGTAPNPLKPLYGAPSSSSKASHSGSGSYSVSVKSSSSQKDSYLPATHTSTEPASNYGAPAPSASYGTPTPSTTYGAPGQPGYYDEFEAAGPASALTGRPRGSRVRIAASSEFGR